MTSIVPGLDCIMFIVQPRIDTIAIYYYKATTIYTIYILVLNYIYGIILNIKRPEYRDLNIATMEYRVLNIGSLEYRAVLMLTLANLALKNFQATKKFVRLTDF